MRIVYLVAFLLASFISYVLTAQGNKVISRCPLKCIYQLPFEQSYFHKPCVSVKESVFLVPPLPASVHSLFRKSLHLFPNTAWFPSLMYYSTLLRSILLSLKNHNVDGRHRHTIAITITVSIRINITTITIMMTCLLHECFENKI